MILYKKYPKVVCDIWSRNSFKFNLLTPGLSDIDFSILIDDSIDQKKLNQLNHSYLNIKKFIPVLGEVNIYTEKNIAAAACCANFFEIQRDPSLHSSYLEYFKFSLSKITFQAAVFLARMLQADYANLSYIPQFREQKWKNHFNQIELKTKLLEKSNTNIDCIIKEIFYLLQSRNDLSSYHIEFKHILQHSLLNDPHYLKFKHTDHFPIFFPHIWIGISILKNSFSHELKMLKEKPNWMLQFMLAQIDWEIWGTSHQFQSIEDYQHLLMRLACFKKIIVEFPHDNIQTKSYRLNAINFLSKAICDFNNKNINL